MAYTPDSDDDDDLVHKGQKRRRAGGNVEGVLPGKRLDKRASGGGANWIAGALKHPGALHEQLHVPEGEKIPERKLEKAAHSDNPTLARRAHLAETLKGLHKK